MAWKWHLLYTPLLESVEKVGRIQGLRVLVSWGCLGATFLRDPGLSIPRAWALTCPLDFPTQLYLLLAAPTQLATLCFSASRPWFI